jgi:transposase
MGNNLRMEKIQQIQVFAQLGWSNRQIHAQTGIDRDTIAKYRRQFENQPKESTEKADTGNQNPPEVPADSTAAEGQNPPEVPTDPILPPSTNSSAIRPYAEIIRDFFLRRLTAQRIYQDLVEQHGYKGSYDAVKRYVRKLRKKVRRFAERLTHLPGREAQVDFGKAPCRVLINGKYRKPWLFKMTLSCSKHAYEELVERQDLETFLRCHERAFRFFGGVPEIVTLDNLKSGVLQASIFDPIINQTYLSFASHWRFAANPCMPRTPEHKGIVERDIGYTKHNALDGKKFESLEEANVALRHWNKNWARTRIHGTTKSQVWQLFRDLELPRLQAVAQVDFEYFQSAKRKVDVNGLVEVEARYYAVPPRYVGETLTVHYNQQSVKIYNGAELIISHRRQLLPGKVSMPASCLPSWKHPDLESQERYYCRKAKDVGPALHHLVYTSLSSNDPLAIRRVRGLLSLSKTFGKEVVEQAASQARTMGIENYHMLKALCGNIVNTVKKPNPPALTQSHELIRKLSEYETAVSERSVACQ